MYRDCKDPENLDFLNNLLLTHKHFLLKVGKYVKQHNVPLESDLNFILTKFFHGGKHQKQRNLQFLANLCQDGIENQMVQNLKEVVSQMPDSNEMIVEALEFSAGLGHKNDSTSAGILLTIMSSLVVLILIGMLVYRFKFNQNLNSLEKHPQIETIEFDNLAFESKILPLKPKKKVKLDITVIEFDNEYEEENFHPSNTIDGLDNLEILDKFSVMSKTSFR